MAATSDGPLAGVKVLDLTQMLAGPYCSMILSDLGADVVKVEPPTGDFTRTAGPQRSPQEPFGGYFQSINRGKRSLVLDLRRDEDRAVFLRLVAQVDIVVENFRAGVMERLGVAYETLRGVNPKLVYGCIRGFGDARTGESPYADWPAYDIVAQAMGGLMGVTGHPGTAPVKSGPGIGDIFPGALLATGLLAALTHVRAGGDGQMVDVAMYDSIVSLSERIVYQYSFSGESPVPQGNTHPIFEPYGVYRCSDGWVALAAPSDSYWSTLCSLLDRPDLVTNPAYATVELRRRHAEHVRSELGSLLAPRTVAAVVSLLGGRVPVGPVQTAGDLFRDPHLRSRDMLIDLEQPGGDRPVTVAGNAIKFTETPHALGVRAPLLGEHTELVLREAGISVDEITALREVDVT